ncbi:MAG: hypothetical protein ACRD15_19895, partial [Vicinamibacterales bacterium]
MPVDRSVRGLVLAAALAAVAPGAEAQPAEAQAAPRIAIEDSLSGEAPRALEAQSALPIFVAARISMHLEDDERSLNDRIARYRTRKVPVWLAISAPGSIETAGAWRARLAGIIARHGDAITILEVVVGSQDPRLAAYAVRLAATDARATRESIHTAVGGPHFRQASVWRQFLTPELAPYVDFLAVPAGTDLSATIAALQQRDPRARLLVTGADAGTDPEQAIVRVIDSELETLGTAVAVHAWQPSETLERALRALTPLAGLMTGEVSELDPAAASLRLYAGGAEVTASVRHRLLFDGRTFATYLAYWSASQPEPLDVSLTLPVEGVPAIYRLQDGAKLQATNYSRNHENGQVRVRVPRPGGSVLIDFNEDAGEVFVERSGVSAEQQLTVEEIIARHQQQQRTQDALVRNYIATARMEQHFRPTMTDPGYDVVTENRYFVADDGIEWEELSFAVNGSKWGSDRPPFPLLQPEKVLSLPLQLRFDAHYQYRLAGTERVGDHDCYV